MYRNNKMRNAINIYKNLPDDIQRKIQFHGRENKLIKKHHHEVIEKIIYGRVLNIEYADKLTSIEKYKYIEKCSILFKLFEKYYEIISTDLHTKFAFIVHYCHILLGDLLDHFDDKEPINKRLIKYNKYFSFILQMDKNLFDTYVRIVYY